MLSSFCNTSILKKEKLFPSCFLPAPALKSSQNQTKQKLVPVAASESSCTVDSHDFTFTGNHTKVLLCNCSCIQQSLHFILHCVKFWKTPPNLVQS